MVSPYLINTFPKFQFDKNVMFENYLMLETFLFISNASKSNAKL